MELYLVELMLWLCGKEMHTKLSGGEMSLCLQLNNDITHLCVVFKCGKIVVVVEPSFGNMGVSSELFF